MDLERWQAGGYDHSIMAEVVAWHRLHNLIAAHLADAQSRDVARRSKKR